MSPLARDLENSILTRRQALHAAGAGAAALVGGGVLAACGSSSNGSSSSSGRSAGGTTAINDQLGWLKTSQWAGFYAAINNGYYKHEGIAENLISGGPNVIASSVVGAGHATVGEDDNNTVLQAIAKGEPLMIFGTIYQRSPYSIFSYPSKPIRTLHDFAGKKIALSPATRPLLVPLLEKAGVSLSSVSFVPAVNVGQFTNHQVDGYFGFSTNEGTVIKAQGINFITTSNWDLGLKSYGNVLITTKSNITQKRDLLVRYLRATIKGWEYAIANPTQMGPLTVQKFAAPGDNVKTETAQAVAQVPLIKNPSGIMRITDPLMQEVIDAMVASKSLPKPLRAQDVMTTDILDAVYGKQTSIPT
ncbi:MAG TPA: ABC transporter substrate-binding protein [Solirubrobacteraceae bacterium]|nr:ABC transporter substrate-binding protein [Solirubrobacteraceae bacterium]